MPRLISLRPGALVSGVDLAAVSWRLAFGAMAWDDVGCFGLIYIPLPLPVEPVIRDYDVYSRPLQQLVVADPAYVQLGLARIPVAFASGPDGIAGMAKVAVAANDSETAIVCRTRVTEALNLFRNGPKVQEGAVASAAARVLTVVDAAWGVRDWIAQGSATRMEWTIGSPDDHARLIGLP